MKNELSNLTRKTLESTFRVHYKQLVAEKMKIDVVIERIKEIIKIVPAILKYAPNERPTQDNEKMKQEINGRLRALLVWLDGKSQFQFQKEIENAKANIKVSYPNLYWLVIGTIFGFFTSNAIHALLKIWGTGRL